MCDRCLERLTMPLSFQSMLGEEELAECLNACTGHYDFSQYVYDNVCLAIPIQRVHTLEKDCDPECCVCGNKDRHRTIRQKEGLFRDIKGFDKTITINNN